MLAVATDVDPPLEDPRLVYEPKYDGIRAIVQVDPGPAPHVRLWSRNGNEKSRQFPELVAALSAWAATLDAPVVLDGEIVALDAEGGRPASSACRAGSTSRCRAIARRPRRRPRPSSRRR